MAFRLSDLNAVTASVGTDLLHLRTVAGLDKKITNTNLFNTIPTMTVLGAVTLKGQTILAQAGGQVGVGNVIDFTSGVQQIILGGNEAGVITDAGPHGAGLFLVDSTSVVGAGGAVYFGSSSGDDSAVGFAAIKGYLKSGGDNTIGNLDTYLREANSDITLTLRERLTNIGNRLIGTIVDSGPRLVVTNGIDGVTGLPVISNGTVGLFQNNENTTDDAGISIIAGRTGISFLNFGDTGDENVNYINVDHSTNIMSFGTATLERMQISTNGNLLIKTTSDAGETVHIGEGGIRVTGLTESVVINAAGELQVDHIGPLLGGDALAIDHLSINRTGATVNYLRCTETGGYLAFNTNNRVGIAGSSLILNADRTSSFLSDLEVITTLKTDSISERTSGFDITFNDAIDPSRGVRPAGFIHAIDATETQIFNALISFLPNDGDVLKITGGIGDSVAADRGFAPRVSRQSATVLWIYYMNSNAGDPDVYIITSGGLDEYNISIAW